MAGSATREHSNEFAEAVARFRPVLLRMARKRTGDAGLAEDVVQEALLKAYASFDSFDRSRPLEPWLRSITIRSCIDQYRRRQGRVAEVTLDGEFGCTQLADPSEGAEVLTALERLPKRDVQLLFQHYVNGYSYEELALQEASTAASVKSAAARARRRLRDALGGVAAWVGAPHARFRSCRAFAKLAGPRNADVAAVVAALLPIVVAQTLWITSPDRTDSGPRHRSPEAKILVVSQNLGPAAHDAVRDAISTGVRTPSAVEVGTGTGTGTSPSVDAPSASPPRTREIASMQVDDLDPAGADTPDTQTGLKVWWEDDGEPSIVMEVVSQASAELCRANVICALPSGGAG